MNIEEKIKSESRKLSDFYYPYYMEERYPGAMKNFDSTNIKYWKNKIFFAYKKYFEKAAQMFCIRKEYDAEKLIQAFTLDKFKYPQQLSNEQVWKTYLKYLPGLHTKKTEEKEIAENIVTAAIEIKKRGSVSDWLSLKTNQLMVINNKIKFNPTLLAFSTSFINFCDENCNNVYCLKDLRDKVYNLPDKRIINKIEDFLKSDFYLFEEKLSEQLEKEGCIF